MHSSPLRIQLSWDDPATGDKREPTFAVPIALGREFSQMPTQLQGHPVSRVVLNSLEVSRFHVLIDQDGNGLVVVDQNSRNGTLINGNPVAANSGVALANGDSLQVGPYQIIISLGARTQPPAGVSQILFNPNTGLPDPVGAQSVAAIQNNNFAPLPRTNFPPPSFQALEVEVQELHATGLPVEEVDYATIGGGLGSFVWVDYLRIYGVKASQIAAIGIEPQPYSRYKQLCLSSQIPLHERLRSNSDSCPDNVWGFPSYAFREAWHDASQGRLGASLSHLWQVFCGTYFCPNLYAACG